MVSCFAADCKHTNESHTCSYFRFPNEFTHRIAYRIWANMCRRTDTNPRATSRLCSCHFPNGVHKIGKEFKFPTIFERKEGKVAPFGIIPHQQIMERTFASGPVIVMSSLDPGQTSYCKLASGSPPHSDDSEDEPENLVINIKEEPADEKNHEEDRRNGEIGDEPDGDMTPHDGEGVATESETDYYKEINLHQISVTGTSGSVANNKLILSPCIPVPAPNRAGGLRHIRPAPSISGKQDGMTPPPILTLPPGLVPINIDPALPIPVPIALTRSNLETADAKKNSSALNNQASDHHLMTLAMEADKIRKKEEKGLQSETGSGSEQGDEGKQSYSDEDVAYSSSSEYESSGGGVGVDSLLNTNDQTLTLIQRRAAEASLSATGSKRSKRKRSQLPDDMKDGTYWERRRKNNEAAKRSRDARRAKEDQIAIRAALLEQENMRLRIEVAALKEETVRLRGLLYEKR